jgi:hypothetical protein
VKSFFFVSLDFAGFHLFKYRPENPGLAHFLNDNNVQETIGQACPGGYLKIISKLITIGNGNEECIYM